MFESMKIEGNKTALKFNYTGAGLVAKDMAVSGHQSSSNDPADK